MAKVTKTKNGSKKAKNNGRDNATTVEQLGELTEEESKKNGCN